jgi:hypothetical protein
MYETFFNAVVFLKFLNFRKDNFELCHDTHHNGIQHNDTQNNDISHNNKKIRHLSIMSLNDFAECTL